MPKTISDISLLHEYLTGVMTRAAHHGRGVDEVALAITGAVVWAKDSDDIRAFEREGEMKNVLWVRIDGCRYAFSYNHEDGTIEVREKSTQGRILERFSNATPIAEVKKFFCKLKPSLAQA